MFLIQKNQKNATNKVEITKIIPLYFHSEVSKLWQNWLQSFQAGGTKLEKFLHKNQRTQRKLLSFESWINGELSKIGHHFISKVI